MVEQSMVERVSRALCETHIRRVRRHDTDPARLAEMMPAAVDYSWRDFQSEARAAIEAMREPDLMMIDAGEDAAIYRPDDVIRNQAEPIYRAMLSAALAPVHQGDVG